MIRLMRRVLGVPSSEIEVLSAQLVASEIARAEHAARRSTGRDGDGLQARARGEVNLVDEGLA